MSSLLNNFIVGHMLKHMYFFITFFIESCRPTLLRMSHGNKRLLTYLYDGAKCVSLETKQITVKLTRNLLLLTIKTVCTLTLITTNVAKFIHLETAQITVKLIDYHKNFLLYH